ncbi:hypothetical protein [Treponema sp. R6D11]
MFFKKDEKSPTAFWREYEEKTGEKVLARGLGKYVCGWEEFDKKGWNGLWGLIINTSGGFRFHHFPQNSIFDALTQFAANTKEPPKEKTIFIPKEKIISQKIIKEEKWYKRLFSRSVPQLIVYYRDELLNESTEKDKKLVFEAEYTKEELS